MRVRAENSNTIILIYNNLWDKELAQKMLDALSHSGYATDTEMFSVDGTKYLAVKIVTA